MKILFIGDVIGKLGRRAVQAVLPELIQELAPDLILANAENIAHGVGVTQSTLQELIDAGVNYFTSGNHIFDKPEGESLVEQKDSVLLRPANYPAGAPGRGYKLISVGSRNLLLINVIGRVFIKENFDCPFRSVDEILAKVGSDNLAGVIVDFHAEATSEKAAMGHYLDGRVSALVGTHTHVPTADGRIFPQGMAFVSDIGMVGATDSVIGVTPQPVVKGFLTQMPQSFKMPEAGEVSFNAVVIDIDPRTGQAAGITRVDRKVKV